MAEYGARVRNPAGNMIIDGVYANLALRASGSVTLNQVAEGGYYGTVSVSGGGTPVLAVNCANYCIVGSGDPAGGVTTFTILSDTQGAVVNWYIYDEPNMCPLMNTNWGIRIKNKTTGIVVFDSRLRYMKVIGLESGQSSATDPAAVFLNKAYTASRVAVVHAQRCYESDMQFISPPPNPEIMVWVYNGAFKMTGSTLTGKGIVTQQFIDTTAPPAMQQRNWSLMAIDVS